MQLNGSGSVTAPPYLALQNSAFCEVALSTESTWGYFHAAPVGGSACILRPSSQANTLLSGVPAPQAALELSLPLKQHEAGLKHLSFWGKILARNGKACPQLLPSLPAPSGPANLSARQAQSIT